MNNDGNNLSAMLERGRLSGRLAIVALLLSFVLALTVFLVGPVYQWSGMSLFTLALVPFGAATIFALSALIYGLFFSKMIEEEEEKTLLERRKGTVTSLLDISEDVRFTAKRTLGNFEKYIPPTLALLCFGLGTLAVVSLWNDVYSGELSEELLMLRTPKNPMNLAVLGAMAAAFSFFGGVFFVGQSHVREFRYLRPVGSWLIFGALILFLSGICAVLIQNGKPGGEAIFEKITLGIYVVLVTELLLNFVMEFYRPRTQEQERPIYESRLLGLFTEPGGVMRNVADSLDYQFGFRVSRTWIYDFLRTAIVPALIFCGFVFWLFTCLAEVKSGEVGIRERFGALVHADTQETLPPGVHLKLPWPFEQIVRVPVDIVQSVVIGSQIEGNKAKTAQVILWNGQSYDHDHVFLVASRNEGMDDVSLTVSILEASLPLYYKAKADRAYDYAFQFKDLSRALTAVGQAETTQYFASTDFIEDISYGRQNVSTQLAARIQKACDSLNMGIEIVCVNMHDVHPPVAKPSPDGQEANPEAQKLDVASAFQDAVCAEEQSLIRVATAQADSFMTVSNAEVRALNIVANAAAYKYQKIQVASAEAERFQRQLVAYRTMPEIFKLRSYLDFLENDCRDLRKYLVSSRIRVRNYMLNLEEDQMLDLMGDLSSFGR